MDTDTLPPIRPQTNEKEDRKAVGFLPSLLSKLGLGGTPAGGGVAAGSSYAGGSGLWAALLGTKAGLVALILAGTTVAAGIGMVGNRTGFFGAGSEGRLRRGFLFSSARGAAGTKGPAQPVADPEGVSSSLDMFVHANRGQGPGAEAGDGTEGAAAESASGAPAPPADGAAPDNTNAPANTGSPQAGAAGGGGKLGPFKGFGGASGGVSGGAFFARGPGVSAGAQGAAGSGRIGALRKSSKAPVVGGGRTAVGRGSRRALDQAAATNRVVRSNLASPNISSQGSGVTYDGGRGAPAIGGAGGIEGGGIGTGGAGVNAGVKPNPSAAPRDTPAPPPIDDNTENATPWQWAIYTAMGAMAVALVAFLAMSYFKKQVQKGIAMLQAGPVLTAPALQLIQSGMSGAKWAAAIATLAGAVATVMGVLIMTTYGQMGQGLIWTAIGGIFTMMAAMQWMNLAQMDDKGLTENMSKDAAMKIIDSQIAPHLGGGGGFLGFGG